MISEKCEKQIHDNFLKNKYLSEIELQRQREDEEREIFNLLPYSPNILSPA